MSYDPDRHDRRSIRLPGYDYAQPGAYFVTICTHRRQHLFGRIEDGEMRLNRLGALIPRRWHGLPQHYPYVRLQAFVVMPNHVHGLLILTDEGYDPPRLTRPDLSTIIGGFKSFAAREVNQVRGTAGPVWQRGFYDHIVRTEESLATIAAYIANNPANWASDIDNRA